MDNRIYYPQKPTLISIDQLLFNQLDKDPNVVAELKYNGNHLILKRFVPDTIDGLMGGFDFWNRHGQVMKYTPSAELLKNLKSLNWKGYCVMDGELLHTKDKSTKHQVVLYDVIIWNGEEVIRKSFRERRAILDELFRGFAYEKLFATQQWNTGFRAIYDEAIRTSYIEGLVMKRLDARGTLGKTSSPVVATMWKVRKPTKNYRF